MLPAVWGPSSLFYSLLILQRADSIPVTASNPFAPKVRTPAPTPAPDDDSPPGWQGLFFSNWNTAPDDHHFSQMDPLDGGAAYEMQEQDQKPPPEISASGGMISEKEIEDVENLLIVGAGPAGLSAAIYAARANLKPLVIARDSGQLASTGEVENYPSCAVGPSPQGAEIIESFWTQAKTFGARSLISEVSHVDLSEEPYRAELVSGYSFRFKALIVATGAVSKRLNAPGEDTYYGKGVASCATCDGWFYRGQTVAVIGGGDTAMETALFLSRICKQVYVVHRRDKFRASKVMAERVLQHPKIAVIWNTTVQEFMGDGKKMTGLALSNHWTERDDLLNIPAAFVVIGHVPNTALFKGGPLEMDEEGYIITHRGTATNMPAVFAAGDVADHVYRQAITSAGTGAMAAMDAERSLCHLGC